MLFDKHKETVKS